MKNVSLMSFQPFLPKASCLVLCKAVNSVDVCSQEQTTALIARLLPSYCAETRPHDKLVQIDIGYLFIFPESPSCKKANIASLHANYTKKSRLTKQKIAEGGADGSSEGITPRASCGTKIALGAWCKVSVTILAARTAAEVPSAVSASSSAGPEQSKSKQQQPI
jgi:hypothetical protein